MPDYRLPDFMISQFIFHEVFAMATARILSKEGAAASAKRQLECLLTN
jgi:hypothetical protein